MLAAALALALAACSREAPPAAPDPGPSVTANTVRFARRPEGIRSEPVLDAGDTTLSLPGRLVWDEDRTVRVTSPFAGRVVRSLVQVGDTVQAGQPLAELASPDYGEALADARKAEADRRLAGETLARVKDLFQAGLVSRKDLREAEAGAAKAEIDRQRAQTRLAQLGGAGGPNFVLRAPLAGVVVERALNPGQEVRPDSAGPALFTITDPTRLWAWLDAPESALPRLGPLTEGSALKLRSGAWGDRSFDALLLRKEDAIDATSRTFRLRVAVANPGRELKAEMYVTGVITLPNDIGNQPIEHVPVAAILLVDGRRSVFVEDSDTGFTRVDVKVVSELPDRVGVTGLTPNQRVVTDGILYLQQILSRASDLGAQRGSGSASGAPGGPGTPGAPADRREARS